MSTDNAQTDLPQIPSLPPIEMLTSPLLCPSPDLAEESALSNAPGPFDGNNGDRLSPPPSLLTPPAGLRKSISVDSFIKHVPTKLARPRVNTSLQPLLATGSEAASRASSPSATTQDFPSTCHRQEQERHPSRRSILTRNRGASVSTNQTQSSPQSYDHSDGERSEDLRWNAGKGKSVSRQTVPDGDLTLPSRLTSPVSSKVSDPIIPERSISLTHKLAKPRSLMSVNTHLHPPKYSLHRPEVVIAVIGTRGCGKSTVIRKGLKAYGLSDASVRYEAEGSSNSIQYKLRIGKIPHGPNAPDSVLKVLEIDLLPSDDIESKLSRLCSGALSLNGTLFCFDVGDINSFTRVESVIRSLEQFKFPSIVLACKSDLDHQVDLDVATTVLNTLDVGLVEATTTDNTGKMRIRDAFELILKLASKANERGTPRNPASPAILSAPGPAPWDISRAESATPTASSTSMQAAQSASFPYTSTQAQSSAGNSPRTPNAPTTVHSPPSRARSMSDLLLEQENKRRDTREQKDSQWEEKPLRNDENRADSRKEESPQPAPPVRAPPWVSLEDLLDKLLFVAVSDDDPVFVNHLFLTYRRFATPRSILLAMQKRMRSLDQPTGDPMFACFAQMKICCLLDNWIQTYRDDFAVPGTSGAFNALIKSILGKTYLLHYGSEFIPFMELLPTLKDKDAFWAIKVESPCDDSDDASSIAEPPFPTPEIASLSSASAQSLHSHTPETSRPPPTVTRERKSSLPLTSRFRSRDSHKEQAAQANTNGQPKLPLTGKQILNKLVQAATKLEAVDPSDIAQEISRIECEYFLQIEPRHWLQHVFAHGKDKNTVDSIARFSTVANHIAHWVKSVILSYDKPKARARQIEKFADVANRLRIDNNYSGLRAIVAGINAATFDGDMSIEIYRAKNPSSWKTLQSFDQLLQSVRSHQKYRMALRNTKGACIPALEVHLSDLIRAHEGNPDFHDDDPAKIHWAKFNMMGRFIDTISQCQKACRESNAYKYEKREEIYKQLLLDEPESLMNDELEATRHPNDPEAFEARRSDPSRYTGDPHPPKDLLLKKIFFW